jgi:hypothetical protein
MFFSESSDGKALFSGDGENINSLTHTTLSTSGHHVNDSVAMPLDGKMYYFRQYNNVLYKYNDEGTEVGSVTLPSTSYAMTTDGTYIYHSYSSGAGQTQYYKTNPTSMSAPETITGLTGGGYYGVQHNQGSYFLYHDGKIYSKQEGSSTYLSIIDLATNSVTTNSDGNRAVGSYSDGACIATTLAGVSYIVEVGPSYWSYYNIATGITVRIGNGSNSSTEYGNGAAEVSPGVVLCFGQNGARITIIDMNPSTPTYYTDTGSHGYSTHYSYGNYFAFCGFIDNSIDDYTYNVYVSGVLIEED